MDNVPYKSNDNDNDNDDDSNMSISSQSNSRDIAPSHISNENISTSNSTQKTVHFPELPKVQPISDKVTEPETIRVSVKPHNNYNYNLKRKTLKAKVINRTNYKYGGRGFAIWKRNGQRAIYSQTELYCSEVFGDDKVGVQRLKRYLYKEGGFKADRIQKVKVLTASKRNNDRFTLIVMRDSMQNIANCIEKTNNGKKEEVIAFYEKRANRYWKPENKRLFVKNFDVLCAADHRKMTNLFLKFGELETDIL
eukprot:TRINITY_DN3513_c0_g2_i2.p1 TRINITY_DN3513_c0_g2~~TRINITY_DN3513_c0_g2_i2.p1  ORF type:complete len:251 (+),score=37.37 TRINITY_DN3513_c0_g2_i2:166-918(+)